jgi:hypothetical protein
MATATSTRRAEVNRRNSQRSAGPRSQIGRERAKMNVLKHVTRQDTYPPRRGHSRLQRTPHGLERRPRSPRAANEADDPFACGREAAGPEVAVGPTPAADAPLVTNEASEPAGESPIVTNEPNEPAAQA